MRTGTYKLILLVLFGVLALYLFSVQVVRGRSFYTLSLKNYIRLIPQEASRGRILDRNNNVIVDNILSFDAVVVPQELKDKKRVFKKLSAALGIEEENLYRIYDRLYANPFTPVVLARGISKATAIGLEEESLELEGAHVELNVRRFYPFGPRAAHVLGYVGEIDRSRITRLKDYGYDIKDKVGYGGIEEVLDSYLRGQKGGQQVEVDNRGRQVRLLGYKPPLRGRDVQVTLDLELQQIADELLQGQKGAIVVMDARTGEILVMASSPAFDPNVFVERKDKKALNYLLSSREAPLLNRAISGQFPLGSVFKVVTAAASYKAKKINPSLTYVCAGRLRVGDRYFKCWSEHGTQDFYQAMGHSCDVYFYRLGFTAGADMLTQTAHDFGLGALTGIDLPQEASGFIPGRMWKRLKFFDGWYDGDTANFSIGQGYVLVTPLQSARMMAMVANGGEAVVPHVTKAVDGVRVLPKESKEIKISPEALKLIRDSLRFPVALEDGTAHVLDIKGLEMCAKTGTAQVHGAGSHGWVAGFFPKDNARYAFCILLENVGSSHSACVLAKELFEQGAKRGKFL
jgi:penicillin-binding protein 2